MRWYRVVVPTARTPFLMAEVPRWLSTTWFGTGRTEASSGSLANTICPAPPTPPIPELRVGGLKNGNAGGCSFPDRGLGDVGGIRGPVVPVPMIRGRDVDDEESMAGVLLIAERILRD